MLVAMILLNGLILGAFLTLCVLNYKVTKELNGKKYEVTQALTKLLKVVEESHNSLIKAVKDLDQKTSEVRLKVDTMTPAKPQLSGRFPMGGTV